LPERRIGLPRFAVSKRFPAHRRRYVVKEVLDRIEVRHCAIVTRCRPPLPGRFIGGRHLGLTTTIEAVGTREATIGAVNAPIDWATRICGPGTPESASTIVAA
jgi:hypothetical protein